MAMGKVKTPTKPQPTVTPVGQSLADEGDGFYNTGSLDERRKKTGALLSPTNDTPDSGLIG